MIKDTIPLLLWHPETAMKIPTRRNWLQKILFPKDFATLSEVLGHYKNKDKAWEPPKTMKTPRDICMACRLEYKRPFPIGIWEKACNEPNIMWKCQRHSNVTDIPMRLMTFPPNQCPWMTELILMKQDHKTPSLARHMR